MNSQLYAHLQSFDSDAAYSEEHPDPETIVASAREREANLDALFEDPMEKYSILVKDFFKDWTKNLVRPSSFQDILLKLLCVLPIGIALGDYIGLTFSLSIAFWVVVLLQVKPDEWPNLTFASTGSATSHAATPETAHPPKSEDRTIPSKTPTLRRLDSCRQEISKMLGLIGAPPMEWIDSMNTTQDEILRDGLQNNGDSKALEILLEFLHAHVQLLWTVDEAYRWLKVSASLHLGLGPQSQSVERVERASLAKELAQIESSDSKLSSPQKLEPQRRPPKSVLSLSLIRPHLAQTMIDQSDSLWEVDEGLRQAMEDSASDPEASALPVVIEGPADHPWDLLEMPDVVDLTWIKAARQQLASLLTHTMDRLASIKGIHALQESPEVWNFLHSSTSNAQVAREHLSSNLLLQRPTEPSLIPDVSPSSMGQGPSTESGHPVAPIQSMTNPNDPLLLALIQYREQLDALSVAVWSCQQYTDHNESETRHNHLLQHGSHASGRQEWWDQMQRLSNTCQTIEQDISRRFFPVEEDLDSNEEESDWQDTSIPPSKEEQQSFEHDAGPSTSFNTEGKGSAQPTNKTLVFRGRGAQSKEKSRANKSSRSRSNDNGESRPPADLPPRDTVSEMLMVQELQGRIKMLQQPEEEPGNGYGDDDNEDIVQPPRQKEKVQPTRAPTAPMFLGVSGSMLTELKSVLPTSSDEHQRQEEILGE